MPKVKFQRIIKIVLIASIAFALNACHSKQVAAPLPYQVKEQIENDFLIIRDLQLKSYLDSLAKRLISNYAQQVTINIAKSPEAFARSFPGAQVLVSTTLIQSCNSESELAFVLAHELGHVLLGHHSQSLGSLSLEELKERELAADSFGINAVLRAGFSISSAISSIQRLTSIWDFYGSQSAPGYPSTAERLSKIQSQVMNEACAITGRCLLEGIENSRDFVKFRLRLSALLSS